MSWEEMLDNVALLYVAGHETTSGLIGNAVLNLLRHREQLELLRSQPSLMDNAVEELNRYEGSIQFAWRYVIEEMRVDGQVLEPGTMAFVCCGSANRDTEHFGADADELNIARSNANEGLSFGAGMHFCLGAHLARREVAMVISRLFERFPGLELAASVTWSHSLTFQEIALTARGPGLIPLRDIWRNLFYALCWCLPSCALGGYSRRCRMTDTQVQVPRRRVSMPFDKPEEGWTVRAGLSTSDVSFEDSTDPEFFKDEMEAVFRRSWIHIGREYQIPNAGDYFTREVPGLDTSLLVSRGRDGVVRAFHNMCSHRGNKLVWEDHPMKEVCGNTRRFACKYHNWQYDPEGNLRLVNKEDWFCQAINKEDYGLIPVACDTWEGFIFINLSSTPKQTLLEQVQPFADGLAGYPFDQLTQCYTFAVEAQANWKIFLDAMTEQYHGNTLHYKLVDQNAKGPLKGAIGSHFEIYDRNSIWSVAVPSGSFDESTKVRTLRPMEQLTQSNLWGQENGPELREHPWPKLLNLTGNPGWSNDMFHIYPNFDMLVWKRGWIMVYSTWPLAVDRVRFEARMYFQPPRNASDRLAQELVGVEFKEFLLQDANLLECAQSMLNKGLRSNFPLCDEEVLVRNNHRTSREAVEAYRNEMAESRPQ